MTDTGKILILSAGNTIKNVFLCYIYLLIDCISARPAPDMLSIKGEYTLRVWNFLMIGLCNSSGNYWFGVDVSAIWLFISVSACAVPL